MGPTVVPVNANLVLASFCNAALSTLGDVAGDGGGGDETFFAATTAFGFAAGFGFCTLIEGAF